MPDFDRYLHTITREDDIHRKRMERGSKRLLQAMIDERNGVDPRTPDKLMWCVKSGTDADYVPHWGQKAA